MPDRRNRPFDLVLFGATAFVGELTASYLAAHAPSDARIALAGRSLQRLERVRAKLPGSASQWQLIQADSFDDSALEELAASTHVVATAVGPYATYGMPLVQACADAGTHYADLTGEVLFIRNSIDAVHHRAQQTGARIVHCCGFDSVPSDLGVYGLHRHAAASGAGELRDTRMVVAMGGAASGGTIDSLRQQLVQTKAQPTLKAIVEDPYSLSPRRAAEPNFGKQSDLHGIRRDPDSGAFVVPFVMAGVNTRVVRRSNALLDHAYGPEFRYREAMLAGRGPKGAVTAAAVLAGLSALIGGLSTRPTRRIVDRILPKPGEGPTVRQREAGYFRISITAETTGGQQLQCQINVSGDPGYKATAVMFGEAALCLAFDTEQTPKRTGVLTPATAMGTPLIERLQDAGHSYEWSVVD